jgi:hypothetical protein
VAILEQVRCEIEFVNVEIDAAVGGFGDDAQSVAIEARVGELGVGRLDGECFAQLDVVLTRRGGETQAKVVGAAARGKERGLIPTGACGQRFEEERLAIAAR